MIVHKARADSQLPRRALDKSIVEFFFDEGAPLALDLSKLRAGGAFDCQRASAKQG